MKRGPCPALHPGVHVETMPGFCAQGAPVFLCWLWGEGYVDHPRGKQELPEQAEFSAAQLCGAPCV